MLPTKALYLVLKTALPDSIDNYETSYEVRLKTQKFIYLFDQLWGEDFYNHSWYLAGPYSSTLTHQIYDDLLGSPDEIKKEWDKLTLSSNATSTINRANELIRKTQERCKDLNDRCAYELVSSVWYIAKKRKDFEYVKNQLLLNKPHFKDVSNVENAIQFVIEEMS